MNRGGELLDGDPRLAQRLLARGLQMNPSESIAWFNLGIGLHQQRRIAAAVRAYRHCLALPTTKKPSKQPATTWLKTYSYSAAGMRDGVITPSVLSANQETIPSLKVPSVLAIEALSSGKDRLLLMSEQGFGDTLQFSRYALHLQQQGFDVTLLSQPALVPC